MDKKKKINIFRETLESRGLELKRARTTTLQINVGLLCNQACRHCHLNAGPNRGDAMMDRGVMDEVAAYARRCGFEMADVTGGAPEMNPDLDYLIEALSGVVPGMMLRSNLTAINDSGGERLMALLKRRRVAVTASFPSINEAQADSQRGGGVFKRSIETLKKLNALGYGVDGSGLELNLVSNPTGAFLPPSQAGAEKRFRKILKTKWGVEFTRFFTFANVPLGRFRGWLVDSGNLDAYMEKLVSSFNPCAVEGLMCRTQVSVSHDGYLYDCDFNLAAGLPMGDQKTHVSEWSGPPPGKSAVSTAEYCYTCTAGAGFT
ncbi:MAG: radical SAM/Cys-rich domain protein [Desulfobacterales bacterium]|nr:radical SAM/Cys-rich domain protein [Desulfobacterales bacterium]